MVVREGARPPTPEDCTQEVYDLIEVRPLPCTTVVTCFLLRLILLSVDRNIMPGALGHHSSPYPLPVSVLLPCHVGLLG